MSNSITSQTPLPHPIPAGDELGPLVGQNFGGYEITSYIGEGPTGAVYRGEDLVGTKMAVKVMHQELSRKDAADALWSDLQKLTALRNHHLVTVYDAGFGDDGQFYYAMDELAGCDLEAGLEESGALTPRKALEILRQVCVAVEAAHAAGVVHGGLKPRNVFLCPRDTELVVKVLDFGAARLAGGVDKGVIVGNPFYMAPEQFGGTAEQRTDVYAIGVMMYELFSGTLPFSGPSHGQVMMRHLSESPSTPPGVDAELGRIILRALAKTPSGRFPTVKQLREALERWAKAQPKLEDIVAHHVISRAQEARAMKQAALSMPDATAQMPRYREEEMIDLARSTRQETAPSKKSAGAAGDNPNSSESVEASLEDFISQANASFPTSDGWDLHTGDVELIDEGEEGPDVEDVSSPKPLLVKPRRVEPAPVAARAPEPVKAPEPNKKHTAKGIPVVAAPEPAPRTPSARMPAVQQQEPPPPVSAPAGGLEALPSSAPMRSRRDPSSQRFISEPIERTDQLSSPIQRTSSMPWTANPLVIIGGLLAAFVIGAMVVFFIIKNIAPAPAPQITVTTPAPQVVYQQQAAPVPVVTPLQPSQPVAVPLGQPQPVAAQPQPAQVPAALPAVAAAAQEPARAPRPKHKREAAAAAPVHVEKKRSDEKPAAAAAPKKEAPAKKEAKESKGGGDWVDPFAQ